MTGPPFEQKPTTILDLLEQIRNTSPLLATSHFVGSTKNPHESKGFDVKGKMNNVKYREITVK